MAWRDLFRSGFLRLRYTPQVSQPSPRSNAFKHTSLLLRPHNRSLVLLGPCKLCARLLFPPLALLPHSPVDATYSILALLHATRLVSTRPHAPSTTGNTYLPTHGLLLLFPIFIALVAAGHGCVEVSRSVRCEVWSGEWEAGSKRGERWRIKIAWRGVGRARSKRCLRGPDAAVRTWQRVCERCC
jgi:hypothetical protein